jgi:hypothetical protein
VALMSSFWYIPRVEPFEIRHEFAQHAAKSDVLAAAQGCIENLTGITTNASSVRGTSVFRWPWTTTKRWTVAAGERTAAAGVRELLCRLSIDL